MWWCGLVYIQVMCQSENQILSYCFRREEVIDQKRSEMVRIVPVYFLRLSLSLWLLKTDTQTPNYREFPNINGFLFLLQAASQFKNSLMKLMEILMSKEPSYVRCIKPNDAKQPGTLL